MGKQPDIIPGRPHHVYTRGNNQRAIFSYPYERSQFLYYVGRAMAKWPCDINAIALMTNHLHLVVTPPTAEHLSKMMAHALQRYAEYRNEARGASGKLFGERFERDPIKDEAHLATVLAYVDLNPLHGGVVDDPAQIEWSTYGLHVPSPRCRIPRGLWTPSPWYLGLAATDAERAARYAEWTRDSHQRHELSAELKRLEAREALVEVSANRRVRRPNGTRGT